MDIIQQIIDFVMSLLGMSDTKKKQSLPGPERSQPAPARKRASAKESVRGLESLEGAEHVKVAAGGVELSRDGAALIKDEDDGTLLWVDQVDKSVARKAWKDVWGPLAGPDDESLASFLLHELLFTMEMSGDARAAEERLRSFGYQDAGHFYRVRATIVKHFATFSGPALDDAVLDSQRVMNASMKAHQQMHRQNMAATAQANPEMLEPIEGVSIELYGQLAAKASTGLAGDAWAAVLAGHGLDAATYERVNAGWSRRMQNDPTATLATTFAQAFQGAGTGKFGAAAQAHAATGYNGTAAGGEAPMPFDQVCEIQGACSAWAKTGQDVNANMSKQFGLTAADFAAAHSWWLSQLMADLGRFDEYNRKVEASEARHAAGAPASPDADLQF